MIRNWKIKNLGDISDIIYGYTDKASFEEIGPKFLRITDIQNNSVDWNSVPYCRANKVDAGKYKLKDGDIVFARTGATTGKSFLVKNPPESVFASYLIKVHLNNGELLPEFLYLFFQTSQYWDKTSKGISGSAQGGFNATKLSQLRIPIPPLPEQQRIVKILDQAFAAIEVAKANAEKNLHNSRELFESYLNNVFANPGGDWELRRFRDVSRYFGRGKSKHRPRNAKHLFGGNYPFIQTGDIRNADHIIKNYSQTYNEVGLAQSKLWPKGTLCITIAANIAETAILDFDACFPDSVIGLIADERKADVHFIEYLMQFSKSQLQAEGKGSAQDNINLATFENKYFPFPSLNSQKELVSKFNSLAKETNKLNSIYQQKLANLEELKKSILQKAFDEQL